MSSKELMIGDKPLSSLRVVDLKEELEKRGLSKSGTKKDLADRLKNHVLQEQKVNQAAAEVVAAAGDEEELPNISMQEKLAEQNPFIRDYFASQAELFHSQKVAKKLLEEEARRESEASQDEGEESSAAEDKDLNSSTEDIESGKVRRLAKKFEKNSTKENKNESPQKRESPRKAGPEPVAAEESPPKRESPRKIVEESPPPQRRESRRKSIEDTPPPQKRESPRKVVDESPPPIARKDSTKKVVVESPPIAKRESPRKVVEEPPPITKRESPRKIVDEAPPPITKRESPRKVSIDEAPVIEKSPIKSTKEKQLEKLAKKVELSNTVQNTQNPQVQKPASPIKQIESKMPVEEVKDKPEEVEKSESESPRSRSSSASSSRSRSKSPIGNDVAQAEKRDNKEEDHDSSTSSSEDQPLESELETEISNGTVKRLTEHFENQSQEKDVAIKEVVTPQEEDESVQDDGASSRSSSRSRSPSPIHLPDDGPLVQVKLISTHSVKDASQKQLNEAKNIISKSDSGTRVKSPISLTRPETKIRSHRIPSARHEEMDDEEALDYGEEEKLQSEPPKFNWTRRIVRLKRKQVSKPQEKKWPREVDSASLENINSESMLQWFSEVKLVPASDLRLEEKEKSPRPSQDDSHVEFHRKISIESEESHEVGLIKMENITITRKVSLVPLIPTQQAQVTEEENDLSPPRNPPSELILITNLVRPFTLSQLRELLQRTGNIQELWVDKIKSKCIVKYEKEEEAFETRAALHGINWPPSNPKALHVDYTSNEKLEEFKSKDAGVIKPVVPEKPVVAENLPVREWDVGKRAKSRSPKRRKSRSRSTSRDRKRARRSPSPHRRRHSRSPHQDRRSRGDAKEHEPLGKALDELFRKTTTTPSIYWLPLTQQQISEKEELRRKRMVERERRLAEMAKIRPR